MSLILSDLCDMWANIDRVGMLYNATVNALDQYEVQRWSQHGYPKLWEAMQEVRFESEEGGVIMFGVDEDMDPKP